MYPLLWDDQLSISTRRRLRLGVSLGEVLHKMLSFLTSSTSQTFCPIRTLCLDPIPISEPLTVILVPPDVGPSEGEAGGVCKEGTYITEFITMMTITKIIIYSFDDHYHIPESCTL